MTRTTYVQSRGLRRCCVGDGGDGKTPGEQLEISLARALRPVEIVFRRKGASDTQIDSGFGSNLLSSCRRPPERRVEARPIYILLQGQTGKNGGSGDPLGKFEYLERNVPKFTAREAFISLRAPSCRVEYCSHILQYILQPLPAELCLETINKPRARGVLRCCGDTTSGWAAIALRLATPPTIAALAFSGSIRFDQLRGAQRLPMLYD